MPLRCGCPAQLAQLLLLLIGSRQVSSHRDIIGSRTCRALSRLHTSERLLFVFGSADPGPLRAKTNISDWFSGHRGCFRADWMPMILVPPCHRTSFLDGDLGPGGQYVSRWGADAILDGPAPTGPLIDAAALDVRGKAIPRAHMPVPVEGTWSSTTGPSLPPSQPQTSSATPNLFMQVALQIFAPLFDPLEELWYVDIALRTDPFPMPKVRLGLVRYQPHAREDDDPREGELPVRLRVSSPVTEWVQPLPGRIVEVTCQSVKSGSVPATNIYVTVRGANGTPVHTADESGPALEIEVIRYRPINGSSPRSKNAL